MRAATRRCVRASRGGEPDFRQLMAGTNRGRQSGSRGGCAGRSGVDEDGDPAAGPCDGVIQQVHVQPGSAVRAGQRVAVIIEEKA